MALVQVQALEDFPRVILTSSKSGEALRELCQLYSADVKVLTEFDFEPKERIRAINKLADDMGQEVLISAHVRGRTDMQVVSVGTRAAQ